MVLHTFTSFNYLLSEVRSLFFILVTNNLCIKNINPNKRDKTSNARNKRRAQAAQHLNTKHEHDISVDI